MVGKWGVITKPGFEDRFTPLSTAHVMSNEDGVVTITAPSVHVDWWGSLSDGMLRLGEPEMSFTWQDIGVHLVECIGSIESMQPLIDRVKASALGQSMFFDGELFESKYTSTHTQLHTPTQTPHALPLLLGSLLSTHSIRHARNRKYVISVKPVSIYNLINGRVIHPIAMAYVFICFGVHHSITIHKHFMLDICTPDTPTRSDAEEEGDSSGDDKVKEKADPTYASNSDDDDDKKKKNKKPTRSERSKARKAAKTMSVSDETQLRFEQLDPKGGRSGLADEPVNKKQKKGRKGGKSRTKSKDKDKEKGPGKSKAKGKAKGKGKVPEKVKEKVTEKTTVGNGSSNTSSTTSSTSSSSSSSSSKDSDANEDSNEAKGATESKLITCCGCERVRQHSNYSW
jgi:hypothetical protein